MQNREPDPSADNAVADALAVEVNADCSKPALPIAFRLLPIRVNAEMTGATDCGVRVQPK